MKSKALSPSQTSPGKNNVGPNVDSADVTTQTPSALLPPGGQHGPGRTTAGTDEAGAGCTLLQPTRKAGGERAGRWDHAAGRCGEDPAGKARKCGYLVAPAPKEKPPPVPVPLAATVVEPSVPVPKEKPVDMAARGSAPSSRKGSGTFRWLQSRGG